MKSILNTLVLAASLGVAGCNPIKDTTEVEKANADDRATRGRLPHSFSKKEMTMNYFKNANLAIREGNLDTLEKLILEARFSSGELYELLRTAITPDSKTPRYSNQKDMVQVLINAGADIQGVPQKGPAPLRGAISVNDIEIATLLLQQGADPNGVAGDLVRTPLQEARRSSFAACEKLLLDHGAKE